MNPDELVRMLTSMQAAHDLARAVRNPTEQTERRLDLSRWRCDEAEEVVRFVHHTPRGQPDVAVLCIPDVTDTEWVYQTTARLAPYPTRLVVLKQ
jgi:hypothetical protein